MSEYCFTCGRLIPVTNQAYGYVGQFCQCAEPRVRRRSSNMDVAAKALENAMVFGQSAIRVILDSEYQALHASLSHLKQCAQAMVDAHPCAVQADCHCPTCTLTHALAAASIK